jgi:UrcA family protein
MMRQSRCDSSKELIMNRKYSKLFHMKVSLSALAAVLISGAVFAEEIGQVTVTASRPTEKIVGRGLLLEPIKEVSLSFAVSYADLDIASHSGAATLESRINDAANKACAQLDKDYALMAPGGNDCVKTAVKKAMVQAHAAIAAAEKKAHGG